MSGDVANPRIWENADVYVVPLGTTMPTNTATTLSSPILAGKLGLISDDGMTFTSGFDENDSKYAYGNILVRKSRSKFSETFTVTALEVQAANVFAVAYPGSTAVTASGVTTRTIKVPVIAPVAVLLETYDPVGVKLRRAIPRVEFEATGDFVFDDSEMAGIELLATIIPSGSGVRYIDITDDPAAVVV
jgi:hypothetical protein